MKIKILDEYHYQTFPIVPFMIDVDESDLKQIGKGKKFDLELFKVVDDSENYAISLQNKAKQDRILELNKQINALKKKLDDTDYKMMKYQEGFLPEEEYIVLREQRQEWRTQINALQAEIATIKE